MRWVERYWYLVGRFVVLFALSLVALGSMTEAKAYSAVPSSWAICLASSESDLTALEASLNPANDTSMHAGTPVMFSGSSGALVTFAVASSAASLSTGPDVDEGSGSAQEKEIYAFTSTKATAAPGTVYWSASFSDATLSGCEGQTPTTYTTAVRTLTVLPSLAEEEAAAKKKKEEEAAARSKREEESRQQRLAAACRLTVTSE
ncbi:MAG TPA: hypothetical protein VIJ50_04970 [Solirubrobacteraceae bacterium]